MKVAIYQKSGILATVLDDVNNPILSGSILSFDNGNISGFNENHILLGDDDLVPETFEQAKLLDKKAEYTFEEIDEMAELRKQQTDLVFELMMKGLL
jgi:hypothetical protein